MFLSSRLLTSKPSTRWTFPLQSAQWSPFCAFFSFNEPPPPWPCGAGGALCPSYKDIQPQQGYSLSITRGHEAGRRQPRFHLWFALLWRTSDPQPWEFPRKAGLLEKHTCMPRVEPSVRSLFSSLSQSKKRHFVVTLCSFIWTTTL